jgi:hypothetical protein
MERLAFSCYNRWTPVIEMLIEALTQCQVAGQKVCTVEHFSRAYSATYSTPIGHSPFSMKNYREHFDPEKLVRLLKRAG